MAELQLSDYARAAAELIERFRIEMEQKAKRLDEASAAIKKLEANKMPTADELKRLEETTRLRDALRKGALEYSRTLDSGLRSLKLRKDTDQAAFTQVQRSLGSKLDSIGLRLSDHVILKVKPIKLNGVMFEFKGRF
jgi:uncharacterized phage infection (PIP) family protein YhgE